MASLFESDNTESKTNISATSASEGSLSLILNPFGPVDPPFVLTVLEIPFSKIVEALPVPVAVYTYGLLSADIPPG